MNFDYLHSSITTSSFINMPFISHYALIIVLPENFGHCILAYLLAWINLVIQMDASVIIQNNWYLIQVIINVLMRKISIYLLIHKTYTSM